MGGEDQPEVPAPVFEAELDAPRPMPWCAAVPL